MFKKISQSVEYNTRIETFTPVIGLLGLVKQANASANLSTVIAEVQLYPVEFKHMPKIAD